AGVDGVDGVVFGRHQHPAADVQRLGVDRAAQSTGGPRLLHTVERASHRRHPRPIARVVVRRPVAIPRLRAARGRERHQHPQRRPVCPTCLDPGTDLDPIDAGRLTCQKAHSFPIVRGIPRFVVSDAYTRSFSYEWNRFRMTQLDSHTGRTDTRDRLRASLNFPLEMLKGKLVLDAGCGMGRFAEVIHRYGGEYVGLDYSFAVDAANANAGDLERVHFVQADLFQPPFADEAFDLVISLGVLH